MATKRDTLHELAVAEYLNTTELLAQEQYKLAEWLEEHTELSFKEARLKVMKLSNAILPGYRGVEKLVEFRRQIRDQLMEGIDLINDENKTSL